MKFFKKTMCETQTLTPLPNPMIRNKIIINDYVKPSITEPDNGHSKGESLSSLNLKLETERLKTFKNWKSDAITPQDLAKAGFYFLNNPMNPDLVRCAFCKAEICRWEHGDNALEEHTRWSPNCPFVKQHANTTRPSLSFTRDSEQGQDVCGNAEVFPNSLPESETFRLLNNWRRGYEEKNKSYDDVKMRLETFKNWPRHLKQKPETLAEAGFYYMDIEDHTICFRCKGALRDWKDDDDPWEQHAMWFPNCNYLLSQKGQEYVDEVQSKLRSVVPCASPTKEEKSGQSSASSRNDGVVTCKICDSNELNVIFIPCKHIIACEKCAVLMDNCPVCRKQIDERMKVFLA